MPANAFFPQQRKSGDAFFGNAKRSGGNAFFGDTKKAEDVEGRVAELEATAAETGAATPESDRPGLFRKVLDIISRPNYAVAGAVEEVINPDPTTPQGLVPQPVMRAIQEIFSGIGPIQGKKRGFGQVMERAGVGEGGALSDVSPFLYSETGEGLALQQGGTLDPTLRGAGGLVLDIAADPTTYLTFGASGLKFTGKAGVKYLSRQGVEEWGKVQAKHAPALKAAAALDDPALRVAGYRAARQAAADEFESTLVDAGGKVLRKELLDPGGVKLFGGSIVRGETVSAVSEPVADVLLKLPGAEKAFEGARAFKDAGSAIISSVFHPFNKLVGLPQGMKGAAIKLHRDFVDANATISGGLFEKWRGLEVRYRDAVKSEPNLGRKFYDIREQTAQHTLTAEQQSLYDSLAKFQDEMEVTGIKLGVLDPAEAAKYQGRYFHHSYVNVEDMNEVAQRYGQPGFYPKTTEKFQRERPFATYKEAVEVTRGRNAVDLEARRAGLHVQTYPELQPNYDVMNNMASYIHQFSEATARKLWYDDARVIFGKNIEEFAPQAVYDLARPGNVTKYERRVIDGATSSVAAAKGVVGNLSPDGKREMFRELLTRAGSTWKAAEVFREFDQYKHLMPSPKVVQAGDLEPTWQHFGEKAVYVPKSSGLWGDKPIMIPELLADDIENFSTKLIESKMWPGVQKMIQGYDWINNWFKTGVYTFWPNSAVRDVYNNTALSMLDMGIGALARPIQTAKLIQGKGNLAEQLTIGAQTMSRGEWRKLAQDLGVVDRSGRSFVEQTGTSQFKPAGKMARIVQARGSIENWGRIQHWLNSIGRGMDPRDAADKVKEFLFAYNELSRVERDVFRRAIPFYTFPRKAIELHARMLTRAPGRVANELKPFRGREDENGSMVQWQAEGLKLRLDRDGKKLTVLNGIDLPIRTLDNLWAGSTRKTFRRLMGVSSPLLKLVPEIGTGINTFTGQPMRRAPAPLLGRALEAAEAPKWLKDWVGYKKEFDQAGRPTYTVDHQNWAVLLSRSWAFSRIATTSNRAFREHIGEDGAAAKVALDFLTGMRLDEMDMDEQMRRRLKERIKALEDVNLRRGSALEHRSVYTPKKQGAPQ